MKLRKLILFILGLLVCGAVAIGLTSINHPIILKWVSGSARHHGKPMPASVYKNGQVTDQIKVYYTDEENSYLLSITEDGNRPMLKVIYINLSKGWIGRPVLTSENDYDLIAGHLFQSKEAGQFTSLENGLEGFSFDPQLSSTKTEIKFNMPADKAKLDSVRIVLP